MENEEKDFKLFTVSDVDVEDDDERKYLMERLQTFLSYLPSQIGKENLRLFADQTLVCGFTKVGESVALCNIKGKNFVSITHNFRDYYDLRYIRFSDDSKRVTVLAEMLDTNSKQLADIIMAWITLEN